MTPEEKSKGISLNFYILKKRNSEAFPLIEELGVDFNIIDKGTALLLSCAYNNTEVALYCLEKGAEVNIIDPDKNTPLIYACIKGNFLIAKMLIERGAQIHLQNKYEKSAISKAIEDHPENLELIELLLQHGGDPFVEENYKREKRTTFTAYDYALKEIKALDIVELINKYYPTKK
jgi:ankyrin repeat protein